MTTETLTLAEFLLARIAEDEAFVERATKSYQHVFGIPHYYFDPNPSPRVPITDGWHESVRSTRRVRGQARRARLAGRTLALRTTQTSRDAGSPRDALLRAVQFLALPYADHEQFRDEWRL